MTNGKQETKRLRRSREEFLAVNFQADAIKQNTVQNKGNFLMMCEERHGDNAASVRNCATNKLEGIEVRTHIRLVSAKEHDLIADKHFTV